MKTLTYLIAVLALGLSLGVGDAQAAKRLGGGKSVGMQKQTVTPDKAPGATPTQTPNAATATAAAPAAAAPAAAAAPKRSWMGPIAGLAAGLGLAALASHFGFGEELANMLLIGLAVVAVLAVVGMVLRKRAATASAGAAGPGGLQYAAAGVNPAASQPPRFDVAMPRGGSMIGSQIDAAAAASDAIPADFDRDGFERNARVQFIRLQAANDAGNLDDLRDFTTPEMFAELRMDITDRGATVSRTEVVQVDASVLEVVEEANRYVVSVRYSGSIHESGMPQPEAFDEVWHLVKPRTGAGGWLVAGITQRQ